MSDSPLVEYYNKCGTDAAIEILEIHERIRNSNLLIKPFLMLFYANKLRELRTHKQSAHYWRSMVYFDCDICTERVLRAKCNMENITKLCREKTKEQRSLEERDGDEKTG